MLDPDLDLHLLCRSGSKNPLIAGPSGSGSAQQFTISASTIKNITKYLQNYLFWTLDPDLDPHILCGSGSKKSLIWQIPADPDPQHCFPEQ